MPFSTRLEAEARSTAAAPQEQQALQQFSKGLKKLDGMQLPVMALMNLAPRQIPPCSVLMVVGMTGLADRSRRTGRRAGGLLQPIQS